MMVMTAKVDFKKILIALAAVAGVILALILLLGGKDDSAPTAATAVAGNDGRVAFLQSLGLEVSASPVESGQVRIPKEQKPVFSRYNDPSSLLESYTFKFSYPSDGNLSMDLIANANAACFFGSLCHGYDFSVSEISSFSQIIFRRLQSSE